MKGNSLYVYEQTEQQTEGELKLTVALFWLFYSYKRTTNSPNMTVLDPSVYLCQRQIIGWSPILFSTTNYLFNQPGSPVFPLSHDFSLNSALHHLNSFQMLC